MKLSDQDKAWALHMVSKTDCLHRWTKDKVSWLKFGIPMVWKEPTNHGNDCYFSAIEWLGSTEKARNSLKYTYFESARRPVTQCDEIPVSVPWEFRDINDEDSSIVEENEDMALHDDGPHPFSQK